MSRVLYMNVHSSQKVGRNNPHAHQLMTGLTKRWSSHAMEYYSVMKRNGASTNVTTGINFENVMLSERGQTKRPQIV